MDPEGIARGTFLAAVGPAAPASLAPAARAANPSPRGRDRRGRPRLRGLRPSLEDDDRLRHPRRGPQPERRRATPGIKVTFYEALALTLAGGFSGLAGAIEVIGVQHRLMEGLTSGYGFTGIVAALLGGLHPIGLIPASIVFGGPPRGRRQDAARGPGALGPG